MWPWGHLAVAYLCYTVYTNYRLNEQPAAVPVVLLGFGALFPDLVDKPLAWYLGVLPTGRTLAHSLLVLVPLSIGVILLARRYDRSEYGVAFAIGAISHALVDAAPVLWDPTASADFLLWPLVSVDTYESGAPTVLELLQGSLTDPYFLSEFVLLAITLVVWRHHGYPGIEVITGGARRLWHLLTPPSS